MTIEREVEVAMRNKKEFEVRTEKAVELRTEKEVVEANIIQPTEKVAIPPSTTVTPV